MRFFGFRIFWQCSQFPQSVVITDQQFTQAHAAPKATVRFRQQNCSKGPNGDAEERQSNPHEETNGQLHRILLFELLHDCNHQGNAESQKRNTVNQPEPAQLPPLRNECSNFSTSSSSVSWCRAMTNQESFVSLCSATFFVRSAISANFARKCEANASPLIISHA